MQYFKGDETELKMEAAASEILDNLSLQKDEFWDDAYSAYPLGDVITELDIAPLARAMDSLIFRQSFVEIFEAFQVAGTFESYITVFEKIFGSDVEITFTVPDPGELTIDIEATGLEESDFVARRIEDNAYIFDSVIWYDGSGQDNIVFETVIGFQTPYELEQMLYEMVPYGIYTEISLTLGA